MLRVPLLIIITCIIAGVYGVLHDQITFSISPEYFTKFKFIQFKIAHQNIENPRLGASIVGFLATWWTGLIIGTILSTLSLIGPTKLQVSLFTKAILICFVIVILTGFIGLWVGYQFPNPDFWVKLVPYNVINFDDYVAVGMMHNFSYLGGAIGLIISSIYIIISGNRQRKKFTVN